MTRLVAAIAAIVIAGGFFALGAYLARTVSPVVIQHVRLMSFLGPATGILGAVIAVIGAVVRKRRASH